MNTLLVQVLGLAVTLLGELMVAFFQNLREARADDPDFLERAYLIVKGIAKDHPDWSNEKKREWGTAAIAADARNLGRDLADSMKNAILEMAVQKLKREEADNA